MSPLAVVPPLGVADFGIVAEPQPARYASAAFARGGFGDRVYDIEVIKRAALARIESE